MSDTESTRRSIKEKEEQQLREEQEKDRSRSSERKTEGGTGGRAATAGTGASAACVSRSSQITHGRDFVASIKPISLLVAEVHAYAINHA